MQSLLPWRLEWKFCIPSDVSWGWWVCQYLDPHIFMGIACKSIIPQSQCQHWWRNVMKLFIMPSERITDRALKVREQSSWLFNKSSHWGEMCHWYCMAYMMGIPNNGQRFFSWTANPFHDLIWRMHKYMLEGTRKLWPWKLFGSKGSEQRLLEEMGRVCVLSDSWK